jgi:hypothetical protein
VQVVPIKNGVMQVFTADTPARVRLVQSLLARRGEYIRNLDQAGERAHLCASCRVMRGAAVSGKLVRQIINLEGGCITLTTSTDLDVVTRIYTLAGLPAPVRPRS